MVRDLIELARPGELKRRPTLINELVGDVLSQLSLQLTHRKIAVDLALADQLPPINLDPERFRQVLVNVVGNAADAMTTGGTLRLVTRRSTAAQASPSRCATTERASIRRFATGCSIRSCRPRRTASVSVW